MMAGERVVRDGLAHTGEVQRSREARGSGHACTFSTRAPGASRQQDECDSCEFTVSSVRLNPKERDG